MKRFSLVKLAAIALLVPAAYVFWPGQSSPARVMIEGYDPVAYFDDNKPAEGSQELAVRHGDGIYHIANVEHREMFIADPERYLPQYDGNCAMGITVGQKSGIDPESFRVVDGRLFLLLNPGTRNFWMKSEARNIERADVNWPKLRNQDL